MVERSYPARNRRFRAYGTPLVERTISCERAIRRIASELRSRAGAHGNHAGALRAAQEFPGIVYALFSEGKNTPYAAQRAEKIPPMELKKLAKEVKPACQRGNQRGTKEVAKEVMIPS